MLELINVSKEFRTNKGIVKAVDNLSFLVPKGQIFTLYGPSGCGKTTTLRLIAGLEQISKGVIRIKGRDFDNWSKKIFVPTNKRNLGMVFQSYAIWPK